MWFTHGCFEFTRTKAEVHTCLHVSLHFISAEGTELPVEEIRSKHMHHKEEALSACPEGDILIVY